MNQKKVNIWLDCDVGNDDAMAIILGLFDPKSNLIGISACFGNTSIENCTSNTLRILSSVGRTEIPVFKGSENSLKSVRITTEAHGKQGLFGYEKLISNHEPVQDISLYDLMKKQIEDEKFTIVITGPQTNIAKLLVDHPDIMEQIEQIIFMGGTSGFGNATPNAEYNIYADPEAAQQVLNICKENQIKLVMISLDLTYTCLVDDKIQNRIKEINTKFTDWCHEMLLEFQEAYRVEEFDYPPLHDPLALFYALHPECYVTKSVYLGVECESKQCYGRTIVDKLGILGLEPNVEFCRKIDVEVFWNHMIDALKCAAKNSKVE